MEIITKIKAKITIAFLLISVSLFGQYHPKVSEANHELENGNYNKAIQLYSTVITKKDKEQKYYALYGRAYSYFYLKQDKKSKKDLRKLLRVKKNHKEYSRLKGDGYWLYSLIKSRKRSTCKSLRLLKKSAKYKKSSILFSTIGFDQINLKRYKRAIKSLNHALELDKNNPWAYSNRALAYLKLNNIDLAKKDIEKSIELDDKNPFAFKHRALIYISTKDLESACKDLEKAKKLNTTYRMNSLGLEEVEILLKNHCYSQN